MIGALRGIGHGFVRQYREYGDRVVATARGDAGMKRTVGCHGNRAGYVLTDAIPRRLALAARRMLDPGRGKQDQGKPCC